MLRAWLIRYHMYLRCLFGGCASFRVCPDPNAHLICRVDTTYCYETQPILLMQAPVGHFRYPGDLARGRRLTGSSSAKQSVKIRPRPDNGSI